MQPQRLAIHIIYTKNPDQLSMSSYYSINSTKFKIVDIFKRDHSLQSVKMRKLYDADYVSFVHIV